MAMRTGRRRCLVLGALALHATIHVGGLFTHWAPRPERSGNPGGRSGPASDLAQEVQAIIDELRLDEPFVEPPGHRDLRAPDLGSQVPTIKAPAVPDATYEPAQSLQDQLEARHWSARPPVPQRPSPNHRETQEAPLSAPPTPPPATQHVADGGLLTALRHWGLRAAPELGQDLFVASLPQIKMLIRAQGEQAGRNHGAGLQALQRYVEQLEMDLDSKEEELSSTKTQLRQEQQRLEEAHEAPGLQDQVIEERAEHFLTSEASEALTAAQAEVARLEEELAHALQGQEEVQGQLQEQTQRAEAAEAKLVNLVERIRGAATARSASR